MSKLYNLFVYGTLRRGCHNHFFMRDAKYISHGRTQESMCLVAHVDYKVPLTWPDPNGQTLRGELYEIDERSIMPIHRMEVNSGYEAKWMTIVKDDSQVSRALVYCHPPTDNRHFVKIAHGDFMDWYYHR